jgi:outer membrane protein TolC
MHLKLPEVVRSVTIPAILAAFFTNHYTGGVDTYLQVITAQSTALSNERNVVDILRRRMDASVLLVKSLAGGWNVVNLPKL